MWIFYTLANPQILIFFIESHLWKKVSELHFDTIHFYIISPLMWKNKYCYNQWPKVKNHIHFLIIYFLLQSLIYLISLSYRFWTFRYSQLRLPKGLSTKHGTKLAVPVLKMTVPIRRQNNSNLVPVFWVSGTLI